MNARLTQTLALLHKHTFSTFKRSNRTLQTFYSILNRIVKSSPLKHVSVTRPNSIWNQRYCIVYTERTDRMQNLIVGSEIRTSSGKNVTNSLTSDFKMREPSIPIIFNQKHACRYCCNCIHEIIGNIKRINSRQLYSSTKKSELEKEKRDFRR